MRLQLEISVGKLKLRTTYGGVRVFASMFATASTAENIDSAGWEDWSRAIKAGKTGFRLEEFALLYAKLLSNVTSDLWSWNSQSAIWLKGWHWANRKAVQTSQHQSDSVVNEYSDYGFVTFPRQRSNRCDDSNCSTFHTIGSRIGPDELQELSNEKSAIEKWNTVEMVEKISSRCPRKSQTVRFRKHSSQSWERFRSKFSDKELGVETTAWRISTTQSRLWGKRSSDKYETNGKNTH